jgi:hypothetical protein
LKNTLVNCHGSVVFRNGNDGVFASNIVVNRYDKLPFENYRAGGVRLYGSGHRVFNNYFEGLNGTSAKAPLALMHGAPSGSGVLGVADGLPATECEVVHNTWVGCAQLRLGYESEKRPLRPSRCVFANNIVCETKDERLLRLFEADGVTFLGNILHATHGKETGVGELDYSESAFKISDPGLEKRGGLFRLKPGSPAIDAAVKPFLFVRRDLDGESRDDKPDIGTDEYLPDANTFRTPLVPSEVGPW